MRSFVGGSLAASEADGLIDGFGLSEVYAWQDNFTYTAAGAPAVTFSASGPDYWTRYHTDYDSIDTLDFDALLPVFQAETRVALDLDGALAPYDFGKRLSQLQERLEDATLGHHGADGKAVQAALDQLSAAIDGLDGLTPTTCSFGHEREALRLSLDGLTALSFLDDTIYPHEQSQWDASMLGYAIAAVKDGDWAGARNALTWVDLTSLADILGREAFEVEQLHHSPDYENLSWGAQGQLSEPLDLFKVYLGLGKAARGKARIGCLARGARDARRTRWAVPRAGRRGDGDVDAMSTEPSRRRRALGLEAGALPRFTTARPISWHAVRAARVSGPRACEAEQGPCGHTGGAGLAEVPPLAAQAVSPMSGRPTAPRP
jgi:hypothetical protein